MLEYSERYASFSLGQGNFEPHDKGMYFVNEKAGFFSDLSDTKLLASTIDTVRQLYRLTPDQPFLAQVHECYEKALQESQYLELHGVWFAVGSGGQSGYKYRLQNNEEGIIIFLKNRRQSGDCRGSHLKIEFSPHYLLNRKPEEVQDFADAVSQWVSVDAPEHGGVALHLALDVQGWEPSEDFLERLTTRSKRLFCHDAIEKVDFSLSEVAVTYGNRQTITVGSVKSVQMCCYDKTAEAKKSDKIHYMESVWQGQDKNGLIENVDYDSEKNVRRIEMRLHHSVMKQFQRGSDIELRSYLQAYEHLGALWRYGMNCFRLDYIKDVIDPYWQLFIEDADFHWCHQGKTYKRAYKKPGVGNEKNVTLALGNWISIIARSKMNSHTAWKCLKKSGMFGDIVEYYGNRGIDPSQLFEMITQSLIDRRMVGKAA